MTSRISAVPLLTGPVRGADSSESAGCYTSGAAGPLTADETYGTVITQWTDPTPVKWPTGFTGRRSFEGQVEVLDSRGNVVVRTGTNVSLMGGYEGGDFRYFVACGWMKTYLGRRALAVHVGGFTDHRQRNEREAIWLRI